MNKYGEVVKYYLEGVSKVWEISLDKYFILYSIAILQNGIVR